MTVIEGVYVFLNVIGNRRCARVFELLAYLGTGACTVVLPTVLRTRNLSLSRLPSCLVAAAFYRVSVEFPFKLSRDFKGETVNVNKQVNKQSGSLEPTALPKGV